VLSVAAIAALVQGSYSTALACTCQPLLEGDSLRQSFDTFDLIVDGTVAPKAEGDLDTQLRFAVETTYDGQSPSQILLEFGHPVGEQQPHSAGELDSTGAMCEYTIYGSVGERYVLFLTNAGNGAYHPAGCGSFAVANEEQVPYLRGIHDGLRGLIGLPTPATLPPGGGLPESHSGDDRSTYVVGLGAILAIAGAALLAFRVRRG
jgi:hypothetical protein